jgi:hypothetical protein
MASQEVLLNAAMAAVLQLCGHIFNDADKASSSKIGSEKQTISALKNQ